MSLTSEEIDRLTSLARLQLTGEEKTRYRQQLSAVLDYIAKLGEVDTTPIPRRQRFCLRGRCCARALGADLLAPRLSCARDLVIG